MRTVPTAVAVLLGLGLGLVGWFLGRASVDPAVQVVEVVGRADPAPIPRPMLESGRGGSPRPEGPAPEAREARAPDGRTSPPDPRESTSHDDRVGFHRWAQDLRAGDLAIANGVEQLRSGAEAPEPPAVADARKTLQSDPEGATAKLEALLERGDAKERAGAYRLLGEARHASHRALVERAQREAKSDEEIKALLGALARFKGPSWNAVQITGPPDTPIAGDLVTAWASKNPEMGEVWIDLEYAEAVTPEAVRVHETYNPGAVARVLALRPDGTWVLLWEGTATPGSAPHWFEPRLEGVRFATTKVRLIVDTSRVEGWNEIDAVELVGDGRRQWALRAQAASNYTE